MRSAGPSPPSERLLIVSPVRDEAAHIEAVARALAAQSRPPDLWVVVDDGSHDETPAILASLDAEIPFMTVISTPEGFTAPARDRLAAAAAPRAFNLGLARAGDGFAFIGKLDGDIELPREYFARLLEEFDRDPGLGIAGGTLVERHGGRWKLMPAAEGHVRGALKLYTRECFDAIGGVEERLGWDGLDETLARMRGFSTRSFEHLVARHHRHTGSAGGRMRGHARWGEGHYVLRYGFAWALARSVKVGVSKRPLVLSGAGYLYGFLRAAVRSAPRVEDAAYGRFVRRELRARMLRRKSTSGLRVHQP